MLRVRLVVVLLVLATALACTKDAGVPSSTGTTSAPGSTARTAPSHVLDIVGTASDEDIVTTAATLQRRFDGADVEARVGANVAARTIEVRVVGDVDRRDIEALVAIGQVRFRPVLANLAPERGPAGSTPRRIQVPTTLDPAIQQQIEALVEQQPGQNDAPTTPADQDDPARVVVLPETDDVTGAQTQRYRLGPAALDGSAIEGVKAAMNEITDEWEVRPTFREGPDGIDALNALAKTCQQAGATCPTGQVAITVDGRVISAPRIEPDASDFTPFGRDSITINGSFTEHSARSLAVQLDSGALVVGVRLR